MAGQAKARYCSDPERSPYTSTDRYDNPKEDVKTIARKLEAILDVNLPHRVADLGCANGELLYHLHARFPHWDLHGFDVTPEFIETARGVAGLEGVELSVCDFLAVEEQFDVVIASCVLSIFPDVEEPLHKMLSLCREGGFLLATGLFNPHDIDVRCEFRDNTHTATQGQWRTEYNRPSQRSIRERFEAEVRSIEFEECPFDVDLPARVDDPIRVWTRRDEHGHRILINGAGQILNQVLLTVQK